MKANLLILFTLLSFTCASFSGAANHDPSNTKIVFTQSEMDWLNQNKELAYVYDPDWRPFEWKNEIGIHTGIIADILQLISKKSGITFVAKNTETWSESVSLVKSEKIGMFSAITKNSDRETYLNFTNEDIFTYPAVLLTKFDDPNVYLDINWDFKNKKIGIVKESGLGSFIKKNNPELSFIEVASTQDGFSLLSKGQIDFFAINTVTAKHYILKKGFSDLKIAFKIDYIYHLNIAMHKNLAPEAISIVDKSLASISKNELNAIFNKWTEVTVTKEIEWKYVYQLTFVLLLLSLFYFWHAKKLRLTVKNKTKELSELADNQEKIILERTAEIEQAEIKLRQIQKMEAIGQLTGGIAHDFNNILGIVQGNLEILRRQVKGNNKAMTRIEAGLKGAARGAALTRKLLDFSRTEISSIQRISINGFIQDMEDLIVKSLTVSVNVELHLDDDTWLVDIDPGDLQDVIINLALNARDAMPDGGNLSIETRNKVLDEKYAERTPGGKAGEFVMLSVSDTGHGMTAAVKERVLEPFFTTKEQGKGTGLGLAMVYGFAKRSGGHLEIYSEPDKGTTIHLYLPRAVNELVSNQAAEMIETGRLSTGVETILVVEDEEDLREIAVLYLESLGYQTRTAENGDNALQVLSDGHDIDLLFSDVIMPGEMDGYQLAMTAHERYPELKVLLTSGFTKKRSKLCRAEDKYLVNLNDRILDKPYNLTELANALQNTMETQE